MQKGYTVKPGRKGKYTVHYECGRCQASLQSPLEEAGEEFPCPQCGANTQTPGIEDLRKRRVAKEQKRIEDAKRLEEERALNELAEARIAAEAKFRESRGRASNVPPAANGLWRICGAWRDTGDKVELIIESPIASKAEAIASGRGVAVLSCDPVISGQSVPIPTAPFIPTAQSSPHEFRALGLSSRPTAWFISIVGLIFSPAIIGIPLLVWGLVADRMLLRHERMTMGRRDRW